MVRIELKLFLLAWLNAFAIFLPAQQFKFLPVFGKEQLLQGNSYAVSGDTVSVTNWRFFISNVELRSHGKTIWKETNSYHLIDIAVPESLQLRLSAPKEANYDQLFFNVGIDSITNVSGVFGGDLDPTKGMYWTWQSGYINFKIEGSCRQCVPAKEYEFHLGGYLPPFATLTAVLLSISKPNDVIQINAKNFLEDIRLSETNKVMSPGSNAVWLSKKIPACFKTEMP